MQWAHMLSSASTNESMDRIGCFDGNCLVVMADHSVRPFRLLSTGDQVLTSRDSAKTAVATVEKGLSN